MSLFNQLVGKTILPDPPKMRFASLSESQLDQLVNEIKKTKDIKNCHKMFWLCYKTNSKQFSVYYRVLTALGRFAKHLKS